jgi:hypothetical protein
MHLKRDFLVENSLVACTHLGMTMKHFQGRQKTKQTELLSLQHVVQINNSITLQQQFINSPAPWPIDDSSGSKPECAFRPCCRSSPTVAV